MYFSSDVAGKNWTRVDNIFYLENKKMVDENVKVKIIWQAIFLQYLISSFFSDFAWLSEPGGLNFAWKFFGDIWASSMCTRHNNYEGFAVSKFWPRASQAVQHLSRPSWVQLNYLCFGVGRLIHKWGLAPTLICECRALDQIAFHVILECPMHRAPRRYHGLLLLDDETQSWLKKIVANIWEDLL